MNPSGYYESIVLCTIDNLKKSNQTCEQPRLVEAAQLSNKTIMAAIARLEKKNRLRVVRDNVRYDYEILDPPNKLDRMTAEVHLEHRLKEQNGV